MDQSPGNLYIYVNCNFQKAFNPLSCANLATYTSTLIATVKGGMGYWNKITGNLHIYVNCNGRGESAMLKTTPWQPTHLR